MQNTVDRLSTAYYYINEDRPYKKLNKEEHLMKKRISFTLALLLILSVCILPFAAQAEEVLGAPPLTPDECRARGHHYTVTVFEGRRFKFVDAAQHEKTERYLKRCECGEKYYNYEITIKDEHTIQQTVSGHNSGTHTVTRYCSACKYVESKYTYICPGNPCIYPNSHHELY